MRVTNVVCLSSGNVSEAESAPLASSSISAGEVISRRVAEKEARGAGLMPYGVRRDWVKCLFEHSLNCSKEEKALLRLYLGPISHIH